MKITLDLSDLVATGRLTQDEAERLRAMARRDVNLHGINILVAFGIVAVAAGVGALAPSAFTALALGALLGIAGGVLTVSGGAWTLLGRICLGLGALAFCGGVLVLDEGSLRAILLDVVILAAAGSLARSGLLVAIAVLAVGMALGGSTDYSHALYSLTITQPTLTIAVFGATALGAYLLSLRRLPGFERLALIAARTAVLMVNLGFWIGSLWGDPLTAFRTETPTGVAPAATAIPSLLFAVAWAVALVVAGAWAVRAGRRWVVNCTAVFAGIAFYTQWFERLGADPLTVLGAGLLMLVFALGLWALNARL